MKEQSSLHDRMITFEVATDVINSTLGIYLGLINEESDPEKKGMLKNIRDNIFKEKRNMSIDNVDDIQRILKIYGEFNRKALGF